MDPIIERVLISCKNLFGSIFVIIWAEGKGWRELTKDLLESKQGDQGKTFVTIKHTEQSKNYQGHKQKDQDYSDVRMYEMPQSRLDPVVALQLMLSKLHPECDALFQTPLKNFDKSQECWFKNEPLGENSISQLMPRISRKAGLSQVYTAHCVRASTITSLHQAGVDAKQICAITKHKNEQSLNSYIQDSSSTQKRACSTILSRPFVTDKSVQQNTVASANSEVNISLASSETSIKLAITPNCQFSNCTFNIPTSK